MIWRASADQLIRQLMEEDGGPLTWPPISETEQNAIYFTCRKLYRFLNHPTSAERTTEIRPTNSPDKPKK